jgi:hypothetical protein
VPGMLAVRMMLMMLRRRMHRGVGLVVRVGKRVVGMVHPARPCTPKRRREEGRRGRVGSAVRHGMALRCLSHEALCWMAGAAAHRELRGRCRCTGDRHGQVGIVVKVRASPRGGDAPRRVKGRRLAVRDGRRLSTVPERVEVVVRMMQGTMLERFLKGRRRRIAAASVDALLVRIIALAKRADKQGESVRHCNDQQRHYEVVEQCMQCMHAANKQRMALWTPRRGVPRSQLAPTRRFSSPRQAWFVG